MSRSDPSTPRPAWRTSSPRFALPAAAIGTVFCLSMPAAAVSVAEAQLQDRDGNVVGNALLRSTPAGALLHVKLAGLPPGAHGFHIHETGKCEPPFDSAGGHLMASDTSHGFLSANGPHTGDMPNIHVPASGALELEVLTGVTDMDSQLFDGDGAALVIHEGADDYSSQPSGAAGPRIACGVLELQTQ